MTRTRGWYDRRLKVLAAVFALSLVCIVGCEGAGWDGDTYEIDLTNDREEALIFHYCNVDNCDEPIRSRSLAPSDSTAAIGTVDVLTWWQVRDTGGAVLGCFRLDFRHRPTDSEDTLYVTKDLDTCP